MKIFTSFGYLSLSGLSYNGIRALSQVYSGLIGTFFSKKRKEKRLGMYLRGIQYDTGRIHIGYVNMSKNGISVHPRCY